MSRDVWMLIVWENICKCDPTSGIHEEDVFVAAIDSKDKIFSLDTLETKVTFLTVYQRLSDIVRYSTGQWSHRRWANPTNHKPTISL